MIRKTISVILILMVFSMTGSVATAQQSVSNKYFNLRFSSAGITSLKRSPRLSETDFILKGKTLGDIIVRYRMLNGEWQDFITTQMADTRTIKTAREGGTPQQIIVYNGSGWYDYYADLEFTNRLRLEEDSLFWTLHFRNVTHKPIEIGDLLLPLPFNTKKMEEKIETETKPLVMHSFISGHGSYIYWVPIQSKGPYLVMTPLEKCPLFEPAQTERNFAAVKLEYLDAKGVYIHSALKDEADREKGRDWDLPRTSHTLTPKFTPGDEITYGFKFRWADNYEEARQILYEEGLFDINTHPGTTLSKDDSVTISFRTKNTIESITPQHPDRTQIENLGEKEGDTHIYKVKFSRLGKNLLTINYSGGRKMFMRFFVKGRQSDRIMKH